MKRATNNKKTKKFLAAIVVSLFNLICSFAGVLAWFASTRTADNNTDMFVVDNKSATLSNVKLYKFDYRQESTAGITFYDYAIPKNGHVNEYVYNKNENDGSYGYYAVYVGRTPDACTSVEQHHFYIKDEGQKHYIMILDDITSGEKHFFNAGELTDDENALYNSSTIGTPIWREVKTMTLYDPIEMIISNSDLRQLNCNAIYELDVELQNFGTNRCGVDIMSSLIDKTATWNDEIREILLSECADFDVYFEYQLDDDYKIKDENNTEYYVYGDKENVGGTSKRVGYYPDFKKEINMSGITTDYYTLTEQEELYYKISYLSSLEKNHANFYKEENEDFDEETGILTICDDRVIELDDSTVKIYINVNYSADELDRFATQLNLQNITAVYDFNFKFDFFEVGSVNP